MIIRELELKDAPAMLEWMQDAEIVKFMFSDFANKTLSDCETFIRESKTGNNDLYMAIADECGNYMGTIGLKHINKDSGLAEFSITIRKIAMGLGYSSFGMKKILNKGLNELELDAIFWCVNRCNTRAIRFYDKNGYNVVSEIPSSILENYDEAQRKELLWYVYSGQNSI